MILKELKPLLAQGLVIDHGKGRATKYRLGQEASERFLIFPR